MNRIFAIFLFCALAACAKEESQIEIYTLYRNVPSDDNFRVHVATFDAAGPTGKGSEFYNWSNSKNCQRAAKMFQEHPDWDGVRFWCEKGPFKE